ncbi:hypothetical protein D3C81_1859860 [compost metagenome]
MVQGQRLGIVAGHLQGHAAQTLLFGQADGGQKNLPSVSLTPVLRYYRKAKEMGVAVTDVGIDASHRFPFIIVSDVRGVLGRVVQGHIHQRLGFLLGGIETESIQPDQQLPLRLDAARQPDAGELSGFYLLHQLHAVIRNGICRPP